MMHSQLYKIADTFIFLNLPEIIDLYKLKAQIPGIKLVSVINNNDSGDINKINNNNSNILYINFIISTNVKIEQDKETINIFSMWNNITKVDLPHLIYGILRKYWIEKNYYPVHSVCFENSLLIGHSGNGKTTLALTAIEKQLNVYSFDKTLVSFSHNNLFMHSGTDVISVRKELINKESYNQKLYHQEGLNNSQLLNVDKVDNGERIIFKIEIPQHSNIINKVYLFYLNDQPLVKKSLNSLSSLHELYPFFLDSTKNDVLINNGEYIFDGNISMQAKQNLMKNLKHWLDNKTVEILIGKKEEIVQYVKSNNIKV